MVAVLGWGEFTAWRSSRRRVGPGAIDAPGSEAVVVLGYRNRGDRANAVNRWRARAGVRTQRPELGPTRLVLCGGTPGGTTPEAELMARHLAGRHHGELVLETGSRTTWENVQNAIPFVQDVDRIAIVSHSLHAEKGRAYLARMRPDLAQRLVPGRDHRVGEWTLIKPALAVMGLRNLRRLDRAAHESEQ